MMAIILPSPFECRLLKRSPTMFRWTVSSCRAIAGTFAIVGFSIPALADDQASPAAPPAASPLPATSLGQPQTPPQAKATKPSTTARGPALPAPSTPRSAQPQPSSAPPDAGRPDPSQSVPPAPALPGLGGL